MTDMLVKLYELPPLEPEINKQLTHGINLRRAIAPEKHIILDWINKNFSSYWASECDVAFRNSPPSCWIAVEETKVKQTDVKQANLKQTNLKQTKLIAFACYDSTCRNFFGPMGVDESMQGKGIGKALVLACLHDMKTQGYGYGIIGGVGPIEFYEKTVGAKVIDDSTPGIYGGMLRE